MRAISGKIIIDVKDLVRYILKINLIAKDFLDIVYLSILMQKAMVKS